MWAHILWGLVLLVLAFETYRTISNFRVQNRTGMGQIVGSYAAPHIVLSLLLLAFFLTLRGWAESAPVYVPYVGALIGAIYLVASIWRAYWNHKNDPTLED